tara:strand:- start:3821 stop:4204 length:384 start_codon:yes stop_codon:yes gene_type:complete
LLHLQQFVKKGTILKNLILLLLIPTLSFSQLEIGRMTVEEDKMLHYIGGVAITSITHDLIFEETKSKEKAVLYSMATTLALSVFKEIWIDNGNMDGDDIAAGMYGALSVGITIELDNLLKRKKKKLK